jgi:hypothetical protein
MKKNALPITITFSILLRSRHIGRFSDISGATSDIMRVITGRHAKRSAIGIPRIRDWHLKEFENILFVKQFQ